METKNILELSLGMLLLHENRSGAVFTGHSSCRVILLACHARLLPFIRRLYVVRIKLTIGRTSLHPVRYTGQSCNVLLSVLGTVWLSVSCVTEIKEPAGQSCAGDKKDICGDSSFCDTDQICSKNRFFELNAWSTTMFTSRKSLSGHM